MVTLFTISLFVVSLLIGLIPALMDSVKRLMRERANLTDAKADWVSRLFYLSWLPAMPVAGWMLDEWPGNAKELLFFAIVALILGIAWLALARSFSSAALNAILLGVAYSCVTTTTIRLLCDAFFAPPNLFAALNVGFIAVGFGALIAPWITYLIEHWTGYRQGLLGVSVALIAPAALVALCDKPLFTPRILDAVAWESVLAHPYLALIVGIIIVYFAIENCLEFWPDAYLAELGYEGRGRHIAMTIFWLAFIATRGVAAWWLYEHPTHGIGLSLLFVILASLVLGNLVSGYEVGSGSFGFWLLGASYGPLLPCLLAIALNLFGPDHPLPAGAQGAILALSGLDTLLVRPIMGAYANGRRARIVMRVPTVLALLMAAPLVVMLFLRRS